MSSPIAKKPHQLSIVNKVLNAFHQKISHSRRIEILSEELVTRFIDIIGDNQKNRCLDVGCGDLGIMERIAERVPETIWDGLDIYDLPEHLANSQKWSKYKKFNGKDLPFEDDSIDIVLFCDTLHHATVNIQSLLEEAHRVGRKVVIKDSFEYSLYSRYILKFMDFIGNWGYGVPLPKNYFTVDSFKRLCNGLGFEIKKMDIGLQIYGHLPIIKSILRPEWHFIAVLEKS